MPESYPIVYEGFRRALVRRFPYAIFYESEDQAITVFGAFHTSRNPAKWQRRLS
jgi:plasmid stabilization system protein ParE